MTKQLFLAIFLVNGFAAVVSAQSNAEQAARNARERFSDIKARSVELERTKREANKRAADNSPSVKFPEIKEDFEKIQKENSDILQLAVTKSPIDYAVVLKSATEINRRAARLKSNLFSADSDQKVSKNKQPNASEPPSFDKLFDALDESLNSFVHSSIFQNIKLVNSTDSVKAQNDLETVIKFSSDIKEKAKKMIKGDSKN